MRASWCLWLLALGCREEGGKAWGECEHGATRASFYLEPIEFAPFAPQRLRVVVTLGGRTETALSTEIRNDGALLDSRHIHLATRDDGRTQLRLTGDEQSPACFVLEDSTLHFVSAACTSASSPASCTYASR